MVRYICDSSCDLYDMEGVDFRSVPLIISTDEREFVDDKNLDVHEMLDYMAGYKGRSFTACPSIDAWIQAMEGADEIYIITITSGLSGAHNSACMARDMFLEDHPDAKICVADSFSTGPEMRMAMEKVIQWKKEGKTFEEVQEELPKYLENVRLYFVLKSLHNLAENGRVNKLVAKALGALNISLLGVASEIGTIEVVNKLRGDKKIIAGLLKEMETCGYKGGKIIITNVENESLAKRIAEAVTAKYGPVEISFGNCTGLTSFYGERGGILFAFES